MNTARALAVIAIALVTGLIGYEIGALQNVAVQAPAAGPVPYGYPFWHFGFGFFGLIFPILFFFLFFGLLRAAFWGGGHGVWHDRRSRLEELHRELHDRQGGGTDQRPT